MGGLCCRRGSRLESASHPYRITGPWPGGGRMGSGGSQVSSSCNIHGVMESYTLPPADPTPGPSWTRDHKLGCRDITEGTVRTPCPLPSSPLTAGAQGHTKPEEEVGTMESAICSWGLAKGGFCSERGQAEGAKPGPKIEVGKNPSPPFH